MLRKKTKLKSLHIFMLIVLLFGLFQPGLGFATDSANAKDSNSKDAIVEEVEKPIEAEVSVEIEENTEVETSTESEKNVDESAESEENAETEELLQVLNDDSDVDISDIVTEAYLDGNVVDSDNNITNLVLNLTDEARILHTNVYDEDGDLAGFLWDESVRGADLTQGVNTISFSTNYCPSFATANDCVNQRFPLPEGTYSLAPTIVYQGETLGSISVGPYIVESSVSEVDFEFELNPDSISQWELARGGVEFWLDAPNGQDATLTVGGQSFEFETRYLHQDILVVDLSPGTYDVELTIGNTTETEQLVVVSNEEFYEDDASHPLLESRHMVLTESEAEEIETIRVYADDLYEHTSIDVFVNDVRVETFFHDWGGASADIGVSGLPLGEHTIAFVHPTGTAEMTLIIVPNEQGAPAPAGTYEGISTQYIGGSHILENPFELPIKFEVDEDGIIKNLEVEYWWVCVLADGQSGFSTSVEMPDTQITVNQAFQIDWEEGASPYSLVGIIHEDGTASGTFYSYSAACGMGASEWNLESDTPPVPQPEPEDFEIDLDPDVTEVTDGSVTITVATTSDSDIISLKWLEGNRPAEDFEGAGNEIDLTTMAFTVGENGTYTIYALNADGVVALSTIEISNIVESDPDPEPQPDEFEVNLDPDVTEETDGSVTITVATTSDSDITSLKWLEGNRPAEDFEGAGNEIDLTTMAFTVGENGTYTIYALNEDGVVALSTIEISNIVESDPDPEPQPDEFEVNLDPDITDETDGSVTITVATTSDSDITSLKWLEGNRPAEDFEGAGNEIDLTTMAFTVGENGTYTIYALNADGVVALSTIEISNIVESDPDPEPQPDEFEVNLDPDITDETDGSVTITVATTSDSDITSLKWLEGNRPAEDFEGTGNEIDLTTMAFTVGENGTYTIYALNADGVVALSTITISNITDQDDGTDPDDGTDLDDDKDSDEETDSDSQKKITIEEVDSDSDKDGETLPKTATNLFNLLVVGGVMLALGAILIVFRRRQNIN